MENKDTIETEEKEIRNTANEGGESSSKSDSSEKASNTKTQTREGASSNTSTGRKRMRTKIAQSTDRKSCILVSADDDKRGSASIVSRNNDDIVRSASTQQQEEPNDDDWDISFEGMFEKLSREADEVIGKTMKILEQNEPQYPESRTSKYSRDRHSRTPDSREDKPIYPFERQKKRHNTEIPFESSDTSTTHKGDNHDKGGKSKKKKNKRKVQNKPIEVVSYPEMEVDPSAPLRLNKFLANAGVCSRRIADELIAAGRVSVNGEVADQLGRHVTRQDEIMVDGKVVSIERKIYVLLNKPRNCVTTSSDPEKRLTAVDLVRNACKERIYPVGRLDRNTSGLLLLTNDGDLAAKLMHPKYEKKKIYQVTLDKPVLVEHMQQIATGIELEDGEIHADAISYVDEDNLALVGIEIHSGRNRIVRRIFEHFGYKVNKLDRVYFAGLTKKDLPRGRWRYLTEDEVRNLRHDFCE